MLGLTFCQAPGFLVYTGGKGGSSSCPSIFAVSAVTAFQQCRTSSLPIKPVPFRISLYFRRCSCIFADAVYWQAEVATSSAVQIVHQRARQY